VDESQKESPAPRKSHRRRLIAIPIVLLIAAGVFIYWLTTRGWVATDDAQVAGHLVPISPRVYGYVDRIYVKDNQHVKAGQTLVRLDTRDFDAQLRGAQANVELSVAQAAAASTQVSLVERTSTAGQKQAGAGVTAADAGVAASQSQIAAAEAQAASAQANADAAREAVAAAESNVRTAETQIAAARAGVQAAEANVASAEAQATKAASDAARFAELFERGAISSQDMEAVRAANISAQAALKAARQGAKSAEATLEQAITLRSTAEVGVKQATARAKSAQDLANQAQTAIKTARTALSQARAQLEGAHAAESGASTAPQQIAISRAQDKAAGARIRAAQAAAHNARLQLSYTVIKAPVEGVVSQKSAELGQFVQPGQLLMSLVPLKHVWVVANFKETAIGHMHPGQFATIEVDAYSGRRFTARVDSVGAATGAQFSLLPPENATGNFIKVVQRVPVKIVLDKALPDGVVLRPGLNVVARVRVSGRRGSR
jgi:membrane fusion protein (multidrug efflux system)